MHACVEAFTGRRKGGYTKKETPHMSLKTRKSSSFEVRLETAFSPYK